MEGNRKMTDKSHQPMPVNEFVCANCHGLFGDLEDGRDPEELCPSCWYNIQPAIAATSPGASHD